MTWLPILNVRFFLYVNISSIIVIAMFLLSVFFSNFDIYNFYATFLSSLYESWSSVVSTSFDIKCHFYYFLYLYGCVVGVIFSWKVYRDLKYTLRRKEPVSFFRDWKVDAWRMTII